jgi:putative serine/threonine protein kinase
MLREANRVNVGPRLFCASDNFLLTEFVDGLLLPKWLDTHKTKVEVRKVLRGILEQCWRLDSANLDHGELSHAPKHVMVAESGMPFLVDFETASAKRHPSNVTSICQFLFIGSETAKKVAELLGKTDRELVVEALRRYKNTRTRENFASVLKACSV